MPWDSFENVALVRTFEKNHVAMQLAIDGGTKMLKLYVGQKNRGTDGQNDSSDFLARNGLAYGSWFYLKGSLPTTVGETISGFLQASATGAITGEKFEDIDTNPLNPTQVVLGDEANGVFVFNFSLDFLGSNFQSGSSGSTYTVEMIVNKNSSLIKQADNVAWTAADLIYVATDGKNGAIWEMDSNGNNQVKIATSKNTANDYNPSGVIDISRFVGYQPASILLATTMNCGSSVSVLINPDAKLVMPAAAPVLPPVSVSAPSTKPAIVPTPDDSVCLTASCPEVLGITFLGKGDLFYTGSSTDSCRELCFFPALNWLLMFFGWKCGPCL